MDPTSKKHVVETALLSINSRAGLRDDVQSGFCAHHVSLISTDRLTVNRNIDYEPKCRLTLVAKDRILHPQCAHGPCSESMLFFQPFS